MLSFCVTLFARCHEAFVFVMGKSFSSETQATIHVVDDDVANRDAMHALFDSVGYHSRCYTTAEEFLAHVTQGGPSCLVADLLMPGMSGLELQRRVREIWPNMAAIIVTAYGDDSDKAQAMRDGADDFLLKPVNDETLIERVEEAVARHEND